LDLLDKFHNNIKDAILDDEEKKWCDDMCLCRYLRARNWELPKSESMIRKTLIWRRKYQPHKITAKDVEIELNNPGKMYRNGFDKKGQPLIYMKPGKDNTGPEHRDVKIKYLVYVMEKASKSIDPSLGVEKFSWIIDYNNYSGMGGISMAKIAKDIVGILQDHYPERLGSAFIINAPFMFEVFWKMISPFVDDVTKAKVKLLKHDDFTELHEAVELDQLETDYGGTNQYIYSFEKQMAFEMKTDLE